MEQSPKQAAEVLVSRGWNDTSIGKRLGVAQSTIYRIRAGEHEPRYGLGSALVKLASSDERPGA